MASPVEIIRPLRRAEYEALTALGAFRDERVELLDGALVPMSPIGPPHSSAVQKLMELLIPPLLGRATVRVQSPFAAGDLSEPEPDVAIVPFGDYSTAHPEQAYAIIEVADSSLASDREVKLRLYALSQVPEYWIVNLRDRCVEVYSRLQVGTYTSVIRIDHTQSLRLEHFPELQIRVADVIR